MSSPKNVDLYSWRNKEGMRGVMNCYNGSFKISIFAPRKANTPPAPPIETFNIPDTEFFSKIRHEAENLWKADIGTTITCVVTKFDQVSKQNQTQFVLTISKENNPEYLYGISFNFAAGSKKEYSFAFDSNKFITITSRSENKVQESSDKFKDFIRIIAPEQIVIFKSASLGDKNSNSSNEGGKPSFTSTVVVEDDIPI